VIPILRGEVGDGPAAVIPPFSKTKKGNPFSKLIATVRRLSKDGKAAERAGESENLPGYSS